MTLELNVFNVCKWPRDKEDDDSENEEIELIYPIIKENMHDKISTNSMEICFASLFVSSKKLGCSTANICSILDFSWVPKDDKSQLNHEGKR